MYHSVGQYVSLTPGLLSLMEELDSTYLRLVERVFDEHRRSTFGNTRNRNERLSFILGDVQNSFDTVVPYNILKLDQPNANRELEDNSPCCLRNNKFYSEGFQNWSHWSKAPSTGSSPARIEM
jgi:hypothetical protein